MSFNTVRKFENAIASFYGAPYGVAVDCCTHGLELALRYTKAKKVLIPEHTYLSVAMLADKLGIERLWQDKKWEDYYFLTLDIIDAAVYWKENSYIPGTFTVISFQFKKHLSLGRGGMILTDNKEAANKLRSMAYDGRSNYSLPWSEQDITDIGYHYYMTPEAAELGLSKLEEVKNKDPKKWSWTDYPNIRQFKVFENG